MLSQRCAFRTAVGSSPTVGVAPTANIASCLPAAYGRRFGFLQPIDGRFGVLLAAPDDNVEATAVGVVPAAVGVVPAAFGVRRDPTATTTAAPDVSGMTLPSSAASRSSPSSDLAAPGCTAAPSAPIAAVSAPAAPASNSSYVPPGIRPIDAPPTAVKPDDIAPDAVAPDSVTLDAVQPVFGL